MKKLLFIVLLAIVPALPALAQTDEPAKPPPLQALVDEGAQVRYLGRHNGLDGWITIRGGQEQYFYATEDGQSILMGLLFDREGQLITVRQVKELQEKSGDVLELFASETLDQEQVVNNKASTEFKTPAQQLYDNIGQSNWIALGNPDAPFIYTFMDPQCPHCHAFTKDLKEKYLDSGLLQVRVIPIGMREDTRAQAAFLLAAPNPGERWYRHLSGDEKALPISAGINQQGVERNLAIMQSWKLDVTPLTIYKAKNGSVKIVQGRPKNPNDILRDLVAE